jgi:8-oxo-dGTP pyrophosphatase MutT (NUDIX family)
MVWKPHATVAAIIERAGRFLLVEEYADGVQVLNQPAGHLEEGEDLVTAAIRETREETGHHFNPEALVAVYLWPQPNQDRTFLRFAFSGTASEIEPCPALDEAILAVHWMTPDELARRSDQLRSPMVLRCIEDYLAGRRYPLDLLIDLV